MSETTGYVITLDLQFLIQLGIQLINTCILCFILYKLLYKPVLGFLNARKDRIATQIDTANIKLKEADELKASYEAKLQDIEQERAGILENARAAALRNSQEILSEAKQEAENVKNRAMLDIQRAQDNAKEQVKQQIIEVSAAISQKFIASNITEAEQEKLVEDTINDLEGVQWLS